LNKLKSRLQHPAHLQQVKQHKTKRSRRKVRVW
jgi:hypothetical protein